ncbi:MAG: glycosyltransferase family 2 protein [Pirellulales bacterium]|nr:glycosyltransferase family 2 protein [Pirellulales bacterium]
MLSAVIPVLNEAASLDALYLELDRVSQRHGDACEFVFVDDGSTDGSWDVICRLAALDPRVRGIRFRRNFGKAAALSAGFGEARGELVMTLDADLQDDPAEIPRFVEAVAGGVDVVSGWKQVRHDPWHKVLPSRVFNWLVGRLTGVKLHDHNCGMKCYRREVLAEVKLYGELHRFVPVLAAARGFRVGELVINHRPRRHGYSKYGWDRIFKGLLDLMTVKFLTGFGQSPQHLLGGIGLTFFALGGVGMLWLTGYWMAAQLNPDWHLLPLHQRPAVLYSLGALLVGIQLMSLGLLAEMVIAYNGRPSDGYSIAERTPGAGSSTGTATP